MQRSEEILNEIVVKTNSLSKSVILVHLFLPSDLENMKEWCPPWVCPSGAGMEIELQPLAETLWGMTGETSSLPLKVLCLSECQAEGLCGYLEPWFLELGFELVLAMTPKITLLLSLRKGKRFRSEVKISGLTSCQIVKSDLISSLYIALLLKEHAQLLWHWFLT